MNRDVSVPRTGCPSDDRDRLSPWLTRRIRFGRCRWRRCKRHNEASALSRILLIQPSGTTVRLDDDEHPGSALACRRIRRVRSHGRDLVFDQTPSVFGFQHCFRWSRVWNLERTTRDGVHHDDGRLHAVAVSRWRARRPSRRRPDHRGRWYHGGYRDAGGRNRHALFDSRRG